MSYLATPPGGGGMEIGEVVIGGTDGSILYVDENGDLTEDVQFSRVITGAVPVTQIFQNMDVGLGKDQIKGLYIGDRSSFGALNFAGFRAFDNDNGTDALFGIADTTDVLGPAGSTNTIFGIGSAKHPTLDFEYSGAVLNTGSYASLSVEKIDSLTDNTLYSTGIQIVAEDKQVGFVYFDDVTSNEVSFGLEETALKYVFNSDEYSLPSTFPTADNQVISVTDFTTGQTEWKSPTFIYDDTTKNIYSFNSGGGAVTGNDNFIVGEDAGLGATGVIYSNFIGKEAGAGAVNAISSNFLGYQSGYGGTGAYYSNFFGNQAGYGATDATYSTFIGNQAGYGATDATYSTFIGTAAGYNAPSAGGSVFIGDESGRDALAASSSVFIGNQSGISAENAENSVFLGYQSGYQAINAINSIFIGNQSGFQDTIDNLLGGSSILIGINTSTGGFSNSIAIGNEAVNTEEYQFMIGSGANPISSIVITGTKTPASATDTGTKGTVCWDENYVYVCTDTDTWKRTAIATW